MARLTFSRRRRWNNHTRNQGVDPLRIYSPSTLEEIVEIVRRAERDGCTVRAIGSGHSWSDVALTSGYMLRPHLLTGPLELDLELLRPECRTQQLVEVRGGTHVRELNAYLDSDHLALPNMGGYDGQTIAGVISTSTHGSGIAFGPMNDLVRSLDIVASGGRVYRIERAGGPTSPTEYETRHPDRHLVQDDHWFNAAVVGMGCMGVIYSVILQVRDGFLLEEIRTVSTWERERGRLTRTVLDEHQHYELYLNPYPGDDGQHCCLVTTRREIESPGEVRISRLRRNLLPELLARLPITPSALNLMMGLWPKAVPGMLDFALRAMAKKSYINKSYRVFNIGAANGVPAYSCEMAVPVDEQHRHIAAVQRIIEIAAERRRLGNVYQGSPISLRFVGPSEACMSMMNRRPTMTMELIQPTHTEGGFELLAAYEDALCKLGGRPHWGQVNTLTGSRGLIGEMYPDYARWQEVHAVMNESGVFNSPFSKRVGISRTA